MKNLKHFANTDVCIKKTLMVFNHHWEKSTSRRLWNIHIIISFICFGPSWASSYQSKTKNENEQKSLICQLLGLHKTRAKNCGSLLKCRPLLLCNIAVQSFIWFTHMQMIVPFIAITFVLPLRMSKCTDTNLVMEKLVNLTKLRQLINRLSI